jgi:hypothetical protein
MAVIGVLGIGYFTYKKVMKRKTGPRVFMDDGSSGNEMLI